MKQPVIIDRATIVNAAKDYADRKVQRLSEKMDSRAKNIHNLRSRDFKAGIEWAIENISLLSRSTPAEEKKDNSVDVDHHNEKDFVRWIAEDALPKTKDILAELKIMNERKEAEEIWNAARETRTIVADAETTANIYIHPTFQDYLNSKK